MKADQLCSSNLMLRSPTVAYCVKRLSRGYAVDRVDSSFVFQLAQCEHKFARHLWRLWSYVAA
ncbi:hypothetical protein EJMOOK_14090 [Rhodanobacter sp. Root179]